jgi:hypothetical protein
MEAMTMRARRRRKNELSENRTSNEVPRHLSWDGESILRWGDAILKEYRRAATMQKCILDAFEQQGWPRRIDNPLPRLSGVHRKQRLRETIKNLNRGLTRRLIVFHADGSGLGVCWTPALGD